MCYPVMRLSCAAAAAHVNEWVRCGGLTLSSAGGAGGLRRLDLLRGRIYGIWSWKERLQAARKIGVTGLSLTSTEPVTAHSHSYSSSSECE